MYIFGSKKGESKMILLKCEECNKEYPKKGMIINRNFPKNEKIQNHTLCKWCFRKLAKKSYWADKHEFGKTELGKKYLKINGIKRRDSKKVTNETPLTVKEISIIKERFSNKCFKCNSTNTLSIDHHYPLNKGFALTLSNAVLLCRSCNSAKSDKMPEDFYKAEELLILNTILRGDYSKEVFANAV